MIPSKTQFDRSNPDLKALDEAIEGYSAIRSDAQRSQALLELGVSSVTRAITRVMAPHELPKVLQRSMDTDDTYPWVGHLAVVGVGQIRLGYKRQGRDRGGIIVQGLSDDINHTAFDSRYGKFDGYEFASEVNDALVNPEHRAQTGLDIYQYAESSDLATSMRIYASYYLPRIAFREPRANLIAEFPPYSTAQARIPHSS